MTTLAEIEYRINVNTRGMRGAVRDLRRFAETADRAGQRVQRLAREPDRAARSMQRQGQQAAHAARSTNQLAQATARAGAQMRSGNTQVDALVRGLTSTDRATQRAARAQTTLLGTLGGSNRAIAQQAQAMSRLATAQAQGVATASQAAQQQRLIAQRFTTSAVNSRDLRLNLQGVNAGMNQLAAAATAAGGPVGRLGAQFGILASTLGRVNPMLLAGVAALAGAGGLAASARRAAARIDQLRLAAATAGMGVQEFDELTFAIQQMAGVTEQRALSAMQRWTRRVGDARDGTGQLAEALQQAGVDLDEFLQLSPDEQFRAFSDRVSELESAQARASLVAAAFGAENVAMTSALAEGSDAIDEQAARARELSSGLEDQAEDAQRLQAAQGELARAVENVGRQLLTHLVDPMDDTLELLTGVFDTVGDLIEAFDGFEQAVRNVGDTALNVLPYLRVMEQLLRVVADADVGVSGDAARMRDVNEELQRMTRLRDQAQEFVDDPDPTATEDTIRAAERQVEVFDRRIRELQQELANLVDRRTLPPPQTRAERPTATTRTTGTDDDAESDRLDAAERMVRRLREQQELMELQASMAEADQHHRRIAVALLEAEQQLRRDGIDLESERAQEALRLTEQIETRRAAQEREQEIARQVERITADIERAERHRAERMERGMQEQERRLAMLQAEQRLLGETDVLRQRELERLRAQHELKRQGVDLSSEEARQYLQNAEAIGEMNAELRRQQDVLRRIERQSMQAFNTFSSGLRDGQSAWVAFREAALDALQAVVDELFRVLVVQQLVNQAASSMFGAGGGAAAPLGGGPNPMGAPANAKGNVYGPSGQMTRFADGGVVSSPHYFPFADGVGLMGEAGPEAIMPLSRTSGGELGVKAQGLGGGDQIVEVYDQRSGGQPIEAQHDEGPDGAKRIRLFIRDEVQRMWGDGGADRSQRRNYGVKRRPVKRS